MNLESETVASPTELHPFVARVFAALDTGGIAWCVLRGEDDLEHPSGDIDLLVLPHEMPVLRAVLAGAGFVEERSWGLYPHRAFLGYDQATNTWLKLDFVTALAFGRFGEIAVPGADQALERRRRVGGVNTLAPEDAFWALLLHCVLDKKQVPPKHQARLRELAGATRSDDAGGLGAFVAHLARVSSDGWTTDRLASFAEAGDWRSLEVAAAGFRASGPMRKARAGAIAGRRKILRALGRRVGLLREGGITVALLGPDGAGKSTLAEGLRHAFPVPVRLIYMGLYKRRVPFPPGVGLLARAGLQFGRYLLGRYHRWRGRVVIFDRYTHDALVKRPDKKSLKTRMHTWLLSHAAPPPDFLLVLDLAGDVLYARKGERDPATLETMRAGYRLLGTKPGAAVVDASSDFEQERREAIALVWGSLARRPRRRSPAPKR